MKGRVHVLCRPGLAAGFRLAGLEATEAEDAGRAAPRLRELLASSDAGAVLVEESLLGGVPASFLLRRAGLPIVLPFPGPSPLRSSAEEEVLAILRQAVGYRVRLR